MFHMGENGLLLLPMFSSFIQPSLLTLLIFLWIKQSTTGLNLCITCQSQVEQSKRFLEIHPDQQLYLHDS